MSQQPRRNAFGILVLASASIGMAIVLLPFWRAIFWAVVLGIMFWPLRQRMVRRLQGRTTVASSLILLVVLLFVLGPALLIAGLVADGAIAVVAQLHSGAFQPEQVLDRLTTRFPKLEELAASAGIDIHAIKASLREGFMSAAQFAVAHLVQLGQGASAFGFQLFLTLYILFSLLLHGDAVYRSVFDAVPLTTRQKEDFFAAFSGMAVATIKGMVCVGIVQAILGAAIFDLLGIDNAPFWGALMGLLSVAPPFGAGFIWAPAGITMLLNGNVAGGLILLAFGAGVISMSDNVVRPFVVRRSSRVPGCLVLVTTLGGIATFGLTGLVLGPVLASLFLAGWRLFAEDGAPTDELDQSAEADNQVRAFDRNAR